MELNITNHYGLQYIACLVIVMVTEIAGAVLALLFRNKVANNILKIQKKKEEKNSAFRPSILT